VKLGIEPTKTDVLVHRLRLMAEAGGVITKDRKRTIMEAAGRLSELDEALKILHEHNGGDADEVN